jgi:hypothetical protein
MTARSAHGRSRDFGAVAHAPNLAPFIADGPEGAQRAESAPRRHLTRRQGESGGLV